jgi:hypothetical protein
MAAKKKTGRGRGKAKTKTTRKRVPKKSNVDRLVEAGCLDARALMPDHHARINKLGKKTVDALIGVHASVGHFEDIRPWML